MSSLLLTFFDDLADMTVQYQNKNGVTVTARSLNIDEKTDSIQTAHLPCRIITTTANDTVTIQRGGNSVATWAVTDLFLLETAARDLGTFAVIPSLMRYKVAYAEALQKQWQIIHGWSTETLTLNLTMQAGKYEFPAQSGVWFYGVKCDLQFEEII